MKRKHTEFTVTALAAHLKRSRAATLKAIRACGIELEPVELHYTDERPRGRRNWRPLTGPEADRVIRYVRARQGARGLRVAKSSPPATVSVSALGPRT